MEHFRVPLAPGTHSTWTLNRRKSASAQDAGRYHSPNVVNAALAGGPVHGGGVVGSSDAKWAFPQNNPKSPQDVLATMCRILGGRSAQSVSEQRRSVDRGAAA